MLSTYGIDDGYGWRRRIQICVGRKATLPWIASRRKAPILMTDILENIDFTHFATKIGRLFAQRGGSKPPPYAEIRNICFLCQQHYPEKYPIFLSPTNRAY